MEHLIRRVLRPHLLPAHMVAGLMDSYSSVRADWQRRALLCGQNAASAARWPGHTGRRPSVKRVLSLSPPTIASLSGPTRTSHRGIWHVSDLDLPSLRRKAVVQPCVDRSLRIDSRIAFH
jgi:hypothetical protein